MRQTLLGLVLLLGACASTSSGAGGIDGGDGPPPDASEPVIDASSWPDASPMPDAGPMIDAADLGCPAYQDRCSGVCIPTSSDPDNCGGCGQVCAPGTGCNERTCVTSVGETDLPGCAGGGPPIDLGEGTTSDCLAQGTFQWAICSCTDIDVSSSLKTDAYNSFQAPYVAGGAGGSVGMNEKFKASGTADISGAMWASSPGGTNPSSTVKVGHELHIGGPFSPKTMTIGGKAFVDGNVSTSGSIVFADVLHQETGSTVSGNVSYPQRVEQPLSVPTPCACAPGELVPIASLVAAAATTNDNALIGLSAGATTNPGGNVRIDLPCGRYYLDRMSGSKSITVVAHGHTALFIGGDIALSKPLTITLDPDASLDVVIAGSVSNSASLTIGSPSYPALSRFYIGGASGFSISSGAQLGAFFYAPYGPVGSSAGLEVFGGVFAGNFHNSGTTQVHYDQAVLEVGDDCGDDGCDSCHDCGNQACVDGTCGACTDSSQCCAPLVCNPGTGTCVPIID
jgi:hypothetical protein